MTKLIIPQGSTELEEMLGDSAKIQQLFTEGQFGDFVKAYAKATMEPDSNLAEAVKAETQRVLAEFLRENPTAVVRPNLTPADPIVQRAAGYNANAPGAKLDAVYAGTADYFRATWHRAHDSGAMAKQAQAREIMNSFGSTVPSDGGFLIPEAIRSELLRVALETAIVRPRARVIPMETLRVGFPAIDSYSNSGGNIYGGVTAYWTEEGAAMVESSAKFSQVVLEAKKLTAYTEVPNELMADSMMSFVAFIDQVFPEALAWFEDLAFMYGTGVGEPKGAAAPATNPAIVATAKESGQAADTIVWPNIVKMFARMLPQSLSRAVWLASPDTFPQLATMALNVGTGGSAVWLNNGVAGPPVTILGRPVIFTEKAKQVGDQGDITFVDWSYYLIGDRQAMSSMSSPHYRFANDKTAIRFIERVDGRPWLESGITPQNGGPTLSPFVQLADRT